MESKSDLIVGNTKWNTPTNYSYKIQAPRQYNKIPGTTEQQLPQNTAQLARSLTFRALGPVTSVIVFVAICRRYNRVSSAHNDISLHKILSLSLSWWHCIQLLCQYSLPRCHSLLLPVVWFVCWPSGAWASPTCLYSHFMCPRQHLLPCHHSLLPPAACSVVWLSNARANPTRLWSYFLCLGLLTNVCHTACWLVGPGLFVIALYVDRRWCYLLPFYLLVVESLLAEDVAWFHQPWFTARGGLITLDTFPNAVGLRWPCHFFGIFLYLCPWQASAFVAECYAACGWASAGCCAVALFICRHRCRLFCLCVSTVSLLAEGVAWCHQPWFPAKGRLVTPGAFPPVIFVHWPCLFFGICPNPCSWWALLFSCIPVYLYFLSAIVVFLSTHPSPKPGNHLA